jgi:hypothetical protein
MHCGGLRLSAMHEREARMVKQTAVGAGP